jgi:hypothetical protein
MKWLALLVVVSTTTLSFAYGNPLSIRLTKIERSDDHVYLLMSVKNKSDQGFLSTHWSCVFLQKEEPVYEEGNMILNVPPRDRANKREIQSYSDPSDKIECRLIDSVPSVFQ